MILRNTRKIICCILFLLFFNLLASSQFNQWTWVKGDNLPYVAGVYGVKGISSPTNNPGSRRLSVSWTDTAGNFWLFGGSGYDINGDLGHLNDLWKYNPVMNEWVWISGDAVSDVPGEYGVLGQSSAFNKPGARRRSTSWIDKSNNLWLFGGNGYDGIGGASYLNDLWKYNISTNQWTWMKGDTLGQVLGVYGTQGVAASANKPGARYAASGWTDQDGRLWLFGGVDDRGMGQEELNDLWAFNTTTSQWTWMKGSNTGNTVPTYGVQGVPSSATTPGASSYNITWLEGSNDLWMFGGGSNSLWKYNTVTNQWTWVKGNTTSVGAIYGTKGVSSPSNRPGERNSAVSWKDAVGNLWMFGGEGISSTTTGYLNDLWRYNPSTNEWTWMKGDNAVDIAGVYGTKGVASPTNNPGARLYAVGWKDKNDNLWLFGGDSYYLSGQHDYLNDLWKFNVNNYITVSNGNWNSTSTWADGIIPPSDAKVIIRNTITVTANTSCYSLKVEQPSGLLIIKSGMQLSIIH